MKLCESARSLVAARDRNLTQSDSSKKRYLSVNGAKGFRHGWIQGLESLVHHLSLPSSGLASFPGKLSPSASKEGHQQLDLSNPSRKTVGGKAKKRLRADAYWQTVQA